MTIELNADAARWTALQNGCYPDPRSRSAPEPLAGGTLALPTWGLRGAEASFRQLKSPLGLRPVYHQKGGRVEAHILVAFLALSMRRTLALWMEGCGLGSAPQALIDELKEIHSLDVILTARDGTPIRLRTVETPAPRVRVLLHHLGLKLPNRPKRIQNVVQTLTPKKSQP